MPSSAPRADVRDAARRCARWSRRRAASPLREPRRSASAGASSTRWRGVQEPQRRRGARPRARPRVERNVPRRRRPFGRRAGGGRGARARTAPRRGRVAPTACVALRPAHAAAADLVEREPGVERDRRRRAASVTIARGQRRRGRARARAASSARTCHSARVSPWRPIARRRRCRRPSGWVTVPSFSA